MSLEDEIKDNLSRAIQEEIDRELMFDLLASIGWTKVVLSNKFFPVPNREFYEWSRKNLTGQYKAHENLWVFEKSEDAAIFMLRWV